MKKNIVFISFAFLVVSVSCRKNYICKCTYSTVVTTSAGVTETTGKTERSFTKVSKKEARAHCTSGMDYSTTGSGTNTVTYDYVENCTLN